MVSEYCTIKLPKWNITFTAENNDTVGKLEINDGQLQFTGNADEAGKIFFNSIGCEFDALRDENKRLQATITELQAKVEELTAALNKYSEDEMLLSDKATITEQAADLVRVRGYLDSERKTARESIAMLRQEFDDMSRYAAARESKITPLKAELNTVIYQNAEAENTIIKLRAEINKLKTSDKVFMETYDELMKVQAALKALKALK